MDNGGKEITTAEIEAAMLSRISPKLLKCEAELFQTKHYDYRLLHPLKATMLFSEAYKQSIKCAISARTDLYVGQSYIGLKKESLLECSQATITGMFKARQHADRHGVPYRFYCFAAMSYARIRNFQHLPRPTNLYSSKPREDDISMIDHILLSWQEARVTQAFPSTHEFYRLENYCGHEYQIDHQRYLIDIVRRTNAKAAVIADFCYKQKILFDQLVVKEYGELGESYLRHAKKFMD